MSRRAGKSGNTLARIVQAPRGYCRGAARRGDAGAGAGPGVALSGAPCPHTDY